VIDYVRHIVSFLKSFENDCFHDLCFSFSGADLSAVLRQAVLFLLEDYRATRKKNYDDLDEGMYIFGNNSIFFFLNV
jgi:hypothetical protein